MPIRRAPALEDKVAALSRPHTYPSHADHVEARETHMSWVFLTDCDVWKLKKPVRFPPLDFSTLDARKRNCEAELTLNRRLAPDVYRRVCRLTCGSDGTLAIDGTGETVDWLVHMRRLPDALMLDNVLARGAVSGKDIDRVGRLLGSFYKAERPVRETPARFLGRYRGRQATNRNVIEHYPSGLDKDLAQATLNLVDDWLANRAVRLVRRLEEGRIVEGHGDLRAEHICLENPPVIIDGLEFSRDLRRVDPVEEVCFLGLDCARLGAEWIGPRIAGWVSSALNDEPEQDLRDFYTLFHACVRARIALRHLDDENPVTPERWPATANAYFSAASPALRRLCGS